MRHTILILLSALLCGIAGGYLGSTLGGAPGAGIPVEPLAPVPAPDPGASQFPAEELDAAVVALELELAGLRSRLVQLEQSEGRAPVVAEQPDEEETLAEMKTLIASMRNSAGQLPPDFETGVSEALQNIRKGEARESLRRQEEQEAQLIQQRITELAEPLGLNRYQRDKLQSVLTDVTRRRTEAFQAMNDTGDWSRKGEVANQAREEMRQALVDILDPVQQEQFRELERNRTRREAGK